MLPKIFKLRAIHHNVVVQIRPLGYCASSQCDQSKSTEIFTNSSQSQSAKHHQVLGVAFLHAQNCRLIHTKSCSWTKTRDGNTTKSTIDQFRAEEEQIERKYADEERQKEELVNEESTAESDDHAKIEKLRSEILEASLKYVSTHGWTNESISLGAESISLPGVAHGMFPNGGIELIHYFYSKCNRELIEKLQQEFHELNEKSDSTVRFSPRDFAIKAVRLRLEMVLPYKDTWPQALAIMTLPQNVPTSLAQLLTLVDDICHCAGDQSVDIGWYTRRVGIASIYKMAELFMLQDKSPAHQQTWEFLERRMDEGIQIQELLSQSDEKTKIVAKAFNSAFQTARNILGVKCDKR